MSQENVEIVRRTYAEGWNIDDIEAVLSMVHPDAEWLSSGDFLGLKPIYRGHAEIRQWWRDLKDPWDYFVIHPGEFIPHGDAVVVPVTLESVGKVSGVKTMLAFVNVFTVEDGLIRRFQPCRTMVEALEAVGRSE